jgi:hypothetical protein
MQYLQNLKYSPTADNKDNVAPVLLDGTVDLQWTISPIGSVDGQPVNVEPGFVAINNISGKFPVTISYGPYVQVCPAYQTQVYTLPAPSGQVSFLLGGAEQVQVYFDETGKFVSTIQNLLAIQQAARGVSLYPFVVYNAASSPQQTTDANSVVEFVGVAVPIVYSMLPITGNVTNGWFQFIFNNGTKPATLTPFGADTINGIYNNAVGFVIYPGEYGILSSDGSQWFAKIFGQKKPSVTYTAFSTTQTPNDIFKRLVFVAGVGQAYSLLSSTVFANGDRVTVKNNGVGVLAITPTGAETINGTFTSGAPLYLYPRDEVELFVNDAGTWSADGTITWISADQNMGEGLTGNLAHNMGGIPDSVTPWLRCIGAEINYTVGDVFRLGIGTASTATNGGENVVIPNAANVFYTISPNAGIRLPNKTTAASSNIASGGGHLTNFTLFFSASKRL